MFLVVFCLIDNIINHLIDLRLADRKDRIATLPCKMLINRG